MNHRLGRSLVIAASLSVSAACGDGTTGCCYDQSWTHEWRVENLSGDSLDVFVRFAGVSFVRHATLAGLDTQILLRRTYFLGGPPNAGEIGCVAVYTMDGILRYQQAPGVPERWVRRDIGTYETQMTLRIELQDLAQDPVADVCALRAEPTINVSARASAPRR